MVHKNTNATDKLNENLVIGVLFNYKDDKDNKFLNDMNLANEKTIQNASINELINKDEEYYYYKGGLTTVPCTENVNWIVYRNIRTMSFEQFNKFKQWIENSNNDYYGTGYGNARGPKKLNGRKIYLENYHTEESSFLKKIISVLPIMAFIFIVFIFFIIIKK